MDRTPSQNEGDADVRLPIIEASRAAGLPERAIAEALGVDARLVHRLAGSRRAWASAWQVEADARPDVSEPPPADPPAPPPVRRAPAPPAKPKRTRLLPYSPDFDPRLGNRIDSLSITDLPIEQLRAMTERRLARKARDLAQERGVPHAVVIYEHGQANVIPIPNVPPTEPDQPVRVRQALHRYHAEDAA